MMPSSTLAPVKSGSLALQVLASLRTAIFQGRYRPGEPLRELQLSKELGVSQMTVREAMSQLQNDGLVVKTPNVGTVVTRLTVEEVRERCAIRIALETMACRLAAANLQQAQIVELETRLLDLSMAVEGNDYYASAQADLEFHSSIWRFSGNRTLARTLEQITSPLFAFVSILRSSGLETLKTVVHNHRPIMEALLSRDEARIGEAMAEHIDGSYSRFFSSGLKDFEELSRSGR